MSDIVAIELDVFKPGSGPVGVRYAMGLRTMGVAPPARAPLESTLTLRASDAGYRTRETDAGGLRVYPPLLEDGLEVTRAVNLAPGAPAAASAWGRLSLSNVDGDYAELSAEFNPDRRTLRVLRGKKLWDERRQIEIDPPYSAMSLLFQGLAQPWELNALSLNVPLRDATSWLERPLQGDTYAGTGGYEGVSDLTGYRKPILRGGALGEPVLNISPTLIDPVGNVWQVSDGPATVYTVYAGGRPAGMGRAPDTADIFSGSTPAGQYRLCVRNDGTWLQTGSPLSSGWALTLDAAGQFRTAGQVNSPIAIVRYLLTEQMGLDPALLDLASFAAAEAVTGYAAGDYWPGEIQAVDAISPLLESVGARLVPTRTGQLRVMLLRPIADTDQPVATLTVDDIVGEVVPRALPQGVTPPPYRQRVTWGRNNTVMTGNLAPDLESQPARLDFLRKAERYMIWTSASLQAAYRTPNDPLPVQTRLLRPSHALALVNLLGGMWARTRELYDVPLSLDDVQAREIGDKIRITYPLGSLARGAMALVVGDGVRLSDRSAYLRVLV